MIENGLYEEKFKNIHLRLKDHEQRISETEDKLIETDKTLAVSIKGIDDSLVILSKLPNSMSKVSEAMTKMGVTMELMQVELKRNTAAIADLEKDTTEKFKGIQNDIKIIDEEGKFNLRIWLRNNWVTLILAGGVIGALVKYFIS